MGSINIKGLSTYANLNGLNSLLVVVKDSGILLCLGEGGNASRAVARRGFVTAQDTLRPTATIVGVQ